MGAGERRGWGQGSIVPVGKRYRALYPTHDPITGARKRLSKNFATEAEALAQLDAWRGMSNAEHVEASTAPRTVRELLIRYLEEKSPHTDRAATSNATGWQFTEKPCLAATWRDYESTAATNILPHLGSKPLGDLTTSAVNEWLLTLSTQRSSRTGKPLSRERVKRSHAVLRQALGFAVKRGWLAHNVSEGVVIPQQRRTVSSSSASIISQHGRAFSREEERRFLAEIERRWGGLTSENPETREDALSMRVRWELLGLSLGLRQAEALGLTWDRVDLESRSISIEQQLILIPWQHGCEGQWGGRKISPCTIDRRRAENNPDLTPLKPAQCPSRTGNGGWFIVPETKASSRGVLAITESQADLLKRLHEAQRHPPRLTRAEREASALPVERADLVVTIDAGRKPGKRVTKVRDNVIFHSLCAEAGIELDGRTVHSLRHTVATRLAEAGLSLPQIMAQMRHSNPQVTQRYLSRTPDLTSGVQEALARMRTGS